MAEEKGPPIRVRYLKAIDVPEATNELSGQLALFGCKSYKLTSSLFPITLHSPKHHAFVFSIYSVDCARRTDSAHGAIPTQYDSIGSCHSHLLSDSHGSASSSDPAHTSAGRDSCLFPFPFQDERGSGYGTFASPMLPPQLSLLGGTLAQQYPDSVQLDQDRSWPLSTYHYPDVYLPEAGGEIHFPSDQVMEFDPSFQDRPYSSPSSFECSAVADEPAPSTAEFSPSSAFGDILDLNWPLTLLPLSSATSLLESSQLSDVPEGTFSSLPSFGQSTVVDQPPPSIAESSSSSASSDILDLNWPLPLLQSSSATSLPEFSELSDVSAGTLFEEAVSEELPGPVDVSQSYRMQLPPVVTSWKCSECAQFFASRVQLRRHERTHQKFLCDIHGCGKSFKMSKDLRRHQATIAHADSGSGLRDTLICPNCGKRTRRKDAHKRHIATHQKETKKRILRAPHSREQ